MNELTQKMIDEALASERDRTDWTSKSAFAQFSKAKSPNGRTIDCEVRSNAVVDDAAREAGRIVNYKVVTTMFFRGALRISRKHAEAILRGEVDR